MSTKTADHERKKIGFAKKTRKLMTELRNETGGKPFVAKQSVHGATMPKLRKGDRCPKCRTGIMINGKCNACHGTGKSSLKDFWKPSGPIK